MTNKDDPYYLIASPEQDWFHKPIQATSPEAAILLSEDGNKLEENNDYDVWEVTNLTPRKFRTEITVQPV
jgi:hypothetical protein